jgi:DNA replication protein DnaC
VLIEQPKDKLVTLKLPGMMAALQAWLDNPKRQQMKPTDLVGMLADAEWLHRENRKLTTRLRQARFRHAACVEDIDYRHPRGLTKTLMQELASSRWVAHHQAVILTGKTGTGKSYLACALGQKACRDGFGVLYKRTSRLFDELAQARADGTYLTVLRRLAKASVLILDDFGLERLGAPERRALLDVLEDRYDVSSTIITSQLEPDQWHAVIGDETAADSICDRLVHNAHRITLDGESLRKQRAPLHQDDKTAK